MKSRTILAAICIFFLSTSISFGYKATFMPRLSVQGEYTDNVLLSENDDAIQDDVITTVSPGFTAEIIGKKGDAKISYDPSYAFYNDFDEFNGWRHKARFSGLYKITQKTLFNVSDNFLYTEDPLRSDNIAEIRTEDPTLPIDSTNRKNRRVYTRNFVDVGLNHQFGEYHSFKLGFTHGLLNEDDPAREDKQNYTPSAGLTYWFGPKWGFEVNGSYTQGEFDVSDDVEIFRGSASLLKNFGKHFLGYIRYSHAVLNYEGESEDDTTYNPSIGIKYDIEKDISLIADIGYFYNDYELRESESAVNGDLRFIKRFERGKINLAALGGYDYSLFGDENLGFEVYYEGSVSGTYQFAKHLSGNVFGSYRHSEYTDASDRKDKRPTVGLGLRWRALEWMSVGLNYRFRSVDSTNDANDYDENRVSVRITLTPTQPFHTSRY